jgi:hypothetical protein
MQWRYLLAICGFLVLLAQRSHGLTCDPLQISFDLCSNDVYCTSSMYIDENGNDMVTFEFLYTRLLGNSTYQAVFEEMLCNETSNNTALPSNFEKLWVTTMGKYRYCNHVNQYFDGLVKKCICKADKLCKYTSANDEEFHFSDNSLFFIALLLSMLLLAVFFVKRNETLNNLLVDYNQALNLPLVSNGSEVIHFTTT